MNEITIPLRYLLAARVFAQKSDARPHLKAVAIDDDHIFATDGSILGAIRLRLVDPAIPALLIPTDAIDYFAKKAKASSVKDVTIRWNADRGELTNGVAVEGFKPVDAIPVPFRRVMPTHAKPEGHVQFQAEFLLKFEKAATLLGTKGPDKAYVLPNGDGQTARVVLPGHPEFMGALSPFRREVVVKALAETLAGGLV